MSAIVRVAAAFVLTACAVAAPAAHAEPASEASIHTLFELMHTRETMETALAQQMAPMREMMRKAFGNVTATAREQAVMDDTFRRLQTLMVDEMRWDKLEPDFVAAYAGTFQQDEIDGVIAFFRTPAGQAYIARMPMLVQKSMGISQAHLQQVMPRVQEIIREEILQIEAAPPSSGPAPKAGAVG